VSVGHDRKSSKSGCTDPDADCRRCGLVGTHDDDDDDDVLAAYQRYKRGSYSDARNAASCQPSCCNVS